jgi:hypothetical protein
MYCLDKDTLVQLEGVPQSSVGAPEPLVMSDERLTFLAYIVEGEPELDGRVLTDADLAIFKERVALVEFHQCRSYMFGSPNDEAIHGHPLYALGLKPYSAFEVEKSSWIRQLERMNSVHPRHNSDRFKSLRHYVFTFHDSTFECIAEGHRISEHEKPIGELVLEMKRRLFV